MLRQCDKIDVSLCIKLAELYDKDQSEKHQPMQLTQKTAALSPEHPRVCVHACVQSGLFPTHKIPYAKKTNFTLLPEREFNATTCFRHLTRKRIPKRYFSSVKSLRIE